MMTLMMGFIDSSFKHNFNFFIKKLLPLSDLLVLISIISKIIEVDNARLCSGNALIWSERRQRFIDHLMMLKIILALFAIEALKDI
jgi:hypothetical protein